MFINGSCLNLGCQSELYTALPCIHIDIQATKQTIDKSMKIKV